MSWSVHSIFGGTGRDIATATTDAQGQYSIPFQPKVNELNNGTFTVEFNKDGYDTTTDYFSVSDKTDSTKMLATHLARKGGRLRIRINGFPTLPQRDTIRIVNIDFRRTEPAHPPTLYDTQTSKKITYSETRITDAFCEVAANQYAFVTIDKRKNGTRTFSRDSIFCPLNQQVTLIYQY